MKKFNLFLIITVLTSTLFPSLLLASSNNDKEPYICMKPKTKFTYTIAMKDKPDIEYIEYITKVTGDKNNGRVYIEESNNNKATNVFFDLHNGDVIYNFAEITKALMLDQCEKEARKTAAEEAPKNNMTEEEYCNEAMFQMEKIINITGNPCIYPLNMAPGTMLEDSKMKLKAYIVSIQSSITEREILGEEKINTPAGTFDCLKIKEKHFSKVLMKKNTHYTIKWYVRGIGIVKEEKYDKHNKLTETQILKEIKFAN